MRQFKKSKEEKKEIDWGRNNNHNFPSGKLPDVSKQTKIKLGEKMGSILEINDTLQLTTGQGFPDHIFNLERHRQKPITMDDVENLVFEFSGKPGPRFFHLAPVRVYWFHNIHGKWLAWGQIVILEQTISQNPEYEHQGPVNVSDPKQWVTSGKYKVLKIFDPTYQEEFSRKDIPNSLSYFER